jgi:hypothetical protein
MVIGWSVVRLAADVGFFSPSVSIVVLMLVGRVVDVDA